MNILIQHDPRSIALRAAGPDPYTLIFRHASRNENTSNRCVVEFLPWKDVSERSSYKLLNSIEAYGCLGLIDIEQGILILLQNCITYIKICLFVLLRVDIELRRYDLERQSIVFMLLNSTL
jgi:hypothetical protein